MNTWDNTGVKSEAVASPSDFEVFLEWLEEWRAEVITSWELWQLLPGEVLAKLLGFLMLALFPNVSEHDPPSTAPNRDLHLICSRHTIDQWIRILSRHPKLPHLRHGMDHRRSRRNLRYCSTHFQPSPTTISLTFLRHLVLLLCI